MSTPFPAHNVHSTELLERTIQIATQQAPDFQAMCDLAVDLQKSLRAAQCDSPRINSDPAFSSVMVQIGQACDVMRFSNYMEAMADIERSIQNKDAKAQRANWAMMAQDGASNLTPLTNSLQKACLQVLQEGADPAQDNAVRLLAHQMAHLTNTMVLTPGCDRHQNMLHLCNAHRALQAMKTEQAAKAPAP